MNERIREFFERYRSGYVRRDASALAEMFAYPSHITSDAGEVMLFSNPSETSWQKQLTRLFEMYDAIGATDAQILQLDARQLSPKIWLAELHWSLNDHERQALYDFHAIYVLAEIAGALCIASVVSPDELPRYKECVARLGQRLVLVARRPPGQLAPA
jgi:hypothetical protein